jgi:hypothetical protein
VWRLEVEYGLVHTLSATPCGQEQSMSIYIAQYRPLLLMTVLKMPQGLSKKT